MKTCNEKTTDRQKRKKERKEKKEHTETGKNPKTKRWQLNTKIEMASNSPKEVGPYVCVY